jgi:hypothetical protein
VRRDESHVTRALLELRECSHSIGGACNTIPLRVEKQSRGVEELSIVVDNEHHGPIGLEGAV